MTLQGKGHTDREFEAELQEIRHRLLRMAGRVEEMITDAVRALIERDPELARRTIEADHKVNRAEVDTDDLCLRVLARRQPLGSDLRFITLAFKMVTDLERIGDLTVNLCERAIDLAAEPELRANVDVERMAQLVRSMVRDAIDAFVAGDADKAALVIERDHEVDERYHLAFREVLRVMLADGTTITRGIHLQSVAKYLERMGDHGTNLAEQVVFMIKGKDIRHLGKLDTD
ncbi:MAG: phosphate signaling complex protein PhoU [Deltaproteobacteria bacterium]|nr:phosphate signaling complex protein PhoU [Deltaproteobacteria bacterium]